MFWPMSETWVVAGKIAAMFLVIAAGWLARRRGFVDSSNTAILSRLVTDLALPCLIFAQLLETVDRRVLAASWPAPALAMSVVILGFVTAWAARPLFADRRQGPTFIFLTGLCNWIYLPLPIVQALYGVEGVRLILLINAGVQLVMWTVGVAILEGRVDPMGLLALAKNPGFIATVGGIALALWRTDQSMSHAGWWSTASGPILEAMKSVGSVTIPMSLLVTGAQLGGMSLRGRPPVRALGGLVFLRLVVVPLMCIGLMTLAARYGWSLDAVTRMTVLIIAMMPVGVSTSLLTERFGGDTPLAAQGILYTTFLSIGTVPLLFALARWVG